MAESQEPNRVPDVSEFDAAIRAHLERMAALRFADASVYLFYTSESWPPQSETFLAEGEIYDYSGRLCGYPDGHLAVFLERDDGQPPHVAEFQRIALAEDTTCLVLLVVKDEQVSLKVQGKLLGSYLPDQDPLQIASVRT